jgi:hypothetical protein
MSARGSRAAAAGGTWTRPSRVPPRPSAVRPAPGRVLPAGRAGPAGAPGWSSGVTADGLPGHGLHRARARPSLEPRRDGPAAPRPATVRATATHIGR